MTRSSLTSASTGLALGLLGASCMPPAVASPNEEHCAVQSGDAWCAERYPDASRPFCARGSCGETPGHDGCVAHRPFTDECYSPCGGGMSLPEDESCLGGTASDTFTGGTTGLTLETEDGTATSGLPCVGDDDCSDAAAPFCQPGTGECVACSGADDPDLACASEDPSRPLCIEGVCMQCTAEASLACVGDTPVCDDETNTCVGCTEHVECGEAACNFYTGACLPADAVVHVGGMGGFGSLTAAVGSIPAGAEGTLIVHEMDFLEAVTVDQQRVIAFLVAPGEQPTWDTPGVSTAPQLTVDDATVIMDGLTIAGNGSSSSPGMLVDGGRLWVDRSRVTANSGGAIVAQGGAELTTRNCFLGGDANDRDAVALMGATASIVYTTIGTGFGMASALSCDAASTVDVRNSILVSRSSDPEVQCNGATIETSAAETALGGTNTALGSMNVGWFFDYTGGDFHLSLAPAALLIAGQWVQGDPAVDIDGQSRPQVDGTMDVAGADLP